MRPRSIPVAIQAVYCNYAIESRSVIRIVQLPYVLDFFQRGVVGYLINEHMEIPVVGTKAVWRSWAELR